MEQKKIKYRKARIEDGYEMRVRKYHRLQRLL